MCWLQESSFSMADLAYFPTRHVSRIDPKSRSRYAPERTQPLLACGNRLILRPNVVRLGVTSVTVPTALTASWAITRMASARWLRALRCSCARHLACISATKVAPARVAVTTTYPCGQASLARSPTIAQRGDILNLRSSTEVSENLWQYPQCRQLGVIGLCHHRHNFSRSHSKPLSAYRSHRPRHRWKHKVSRL